MKVRLSYSVELEEVPANIANILEDDAAVLSDSALKLEWIVSRLGDDNPNASTILKKIDEIRINLGSVDSKLNECSSILQGYLNALNPAPAPSEEPTE
jgi:hypothetical protein